MHRRLLSSLAPSVRARLWLLLAVVAVPAAFLAGGLIFNSYRNERNAMERHLAESVRALTDYLERHPESLIRGRRGATP